MKIFKLILSVSLFFFFSCGSENIDTSLEPKNTYELNSLNYLQITNNDFTDSQLRDLCDCKMKILSIENLWDTWYWTVLDKTGYTNIGDSEYIIWGKGQNIWFDPFEVGNDLPYNIPNINEKSLPTLSYELNNPSYGLHEILILLDTRPINISIDDIEVPDPLKFHVEINCLGGNKYEKTFEWYAGDPQTSSDGRVFYSTFIENIVCTYSIKK